MTRVPIIDEEVIPDTFDIFEELPSDFYRDITPEYWNNAGTVLAFANNAELAKLHVHVNTKLWMDTGLTPTETEYVILTVARELDSSYIWHPHALIAVYQANASKKNIIAIGSRNTDALDGKLRALIKYVVEFVQKNGNVGEKTHYELSEYFDESTIIGIIMLAGFYIHLFHVASALQLSHDEEVIGWGLENFPSSHNRYG